MRQVAITAALLSSFAACTDQPVLATGPVLLTGHDVAVTDTGEQRIELTAADVTVFNLTANGDQTELAVVQTSEGLSVANAPDGIYYIKRGDILVATDAREVDISTVLLGRPDVVQAQQPTLLDLQLEELAPWQAGDAFQLYSAGAGLWSPAFLLPKSPTDPSSAQVLLDFAELKLPLVDSTQGDQLHITVLRERTIDGRRYNAALRSTVTTIDMTSANPQVTATLTESPLQQLAIDWRVDEFDRTRQDVQPIAITAFYDVSLAAMPAGARHGQYGASADLINLRAQDLGTSLTGVLSFADPYPAQWTRIATHVAWYPVTYTLANTSRSTLWDGLWSRESWTGSALELLPFVGPPIAVDINWSRGLCISWEPPVTGTASSYQLTIHHLFDDNGASRLSPALGARTDQTELCIANNLLDPAAGAIVVQVGAVFGTDNVSTRPFATTLPYGYAETSQLAPPRPQ